MNRMSIYIRNMIIVIVLLFVTIFFVACGEVDNHLDEDNLNIQTEYEELLKLYEELLQQKDKLMDFNKNLAIENNSLSDQYGQLMSQFQETKLQLENLEDEYLDLDSLYLKVLNEHKEEVNNLFAMFEHLSLNVTKANVMINATSWEILFGVKYNGITTQGSGVIFYESDKYFYVLTNNHVVFHGDEYTESEFEIIDYKMEKHRGELLHRSPNYDLAVVYFPKVDGLEALCLADEDAEVDDLVISIGQPENQLNTITFGNVLDYRKPKFSATDPALINVAFNCVVHNAYTNSGASGSMLINENYEIVGIHAFGTKSADESLAIPVSKIITYLQENNWSFVIS